MKPRKSQLPSDRSFGLTAALTCFLVLVARLLKGHGPAPDLLLVSVILLTLSFINPGALHPLNRAWMRLAEVLNWFVSPIVLGVLYFGVLTPVGLIRRWAGADPLKLELAASSVSYWQARSMRQVTKDGLKQQF